MNPHWQIRAELELPDATTVATLPAGWRWSDVCFWVVNSDGVANDPQRRLIRRGGQLHTAAYRSPAELAAACHWVFRDLEPQINYRASMRIIMHLPGLSGDLRGLKQLCDYTRAHMPPLWPRLDPLDALLTLQHDQRAAKAAHARLTATIRARHFLVSTRRHDARMNAGSVREFTEHEKDAKLDGRPAYLTASREAVDVRDITDGSRVVFRCFAQAADAREVEAAAGFSQDWCSAALTGTGPAAVIARWETHLPRQLPFVHRLELGWAHTNFHHHSRRAVSARLAEAGISR